MPEYLTMKCKNQILTITKSVYLYGFYSWNEIHKFLCALYGSSELRIISSWFFITVIINNSGFSSELPVVGNSANTSLKISEMDKETLLIVFEIRTVFPCLNHWLMMVKGFPGTPLYVLWSGTDEIEVICIKIPSDFGSNTLGLIRKMQLSSKELSFQFLTLPPPQINVLKGLSLSHLTKAFGPSCLQSSPSLTDISVWESCCTGIIQETCWPQLCSFLQLHSLLPTWVDSRVEKWWSLLLYLY